MHQQLWAPWRLEYVSKPSSGTSESKNIFLELPTAGDDEKNLILHRGSLSFILLNAYPYSNGHLMVAPFRQVFDITELTPEEFAEIGLYLQRAVGWLKQIYNPNGFNIGLNLGSAAGAGIPVHLHWHVVPRWNGDSNFMTTIGETRVIPESLSSTYSKLRAVIQQ